MNTNSKAISVILTLLLAASLGACSSANKDTTPAASPGTPSASPSK